jgi:hypothetical protein
MADPASQASPPPQGDDTAPAPPKKPRSSAPLAAAVALLLGIPLAGFGLKIWGPILFAPEEAPRAVMEVTGPRKIEVAGATPVETRGSSIDMVRGDAGAPQAAGTAAAAGAGAGAQAVPAPPSSGAPAPQTARPQDQPPKPGQKAYPKLKPNHGWTNWFWRQGLPATVEPDPPRQHAAGTEENIKQVEAVAAAKAQATAPTASADSSKPGASGVSPASPPAPAKPARQGYKPPVPVYSAADQATHVGPGIGGGTLEASAGQAQPSGGKRVWTEHSTFVNPPDAAPEPNPEKPRTPDGPCPRRGWWKSPYTGYCYYSHAACNASDYEHRGCVQPNP